MVGDVFVGGVNVRRVGVVFGCRQIQLSEASNVNVVFLKYVFVCGVVVVVGVSVSVGVASGAVVSVVVGGVNVRCVGVVFGCLQMQLSEASKVIVELLKYVFVCGVVVVVGVFGSVDASGTVVGDVVGGGVGIKNRTSACTRTRTSTHTRGSSRWRCRHGTRTSTYFTRNGWSRCLKLISSFSLCSK